MKIYNITLRNILDNQTCTISWEEKKNEDYMIFLWSMAYLKCDCNRLILWHGYNSTYPCNTNNDDRLIKCEIRDELDNLIYKED